MPWYENDVEGDFTGKFAIASSASVTRSLNGSFRLYWLIPIPASAGYVSGIRFKINTWGVPMDRIPFLGDFIYPYSMNDHGIRVAAYAPWDPGVGFFRPGVLMANAQYYPSATGIITYMFLSKAVIGTTAFIVFTGIGAHITQADPSRPFLHGGQFNAAARGVWILDDITDERYYEQWKPDLSGVGMAFATTFQPYLAVYYTPDVDNYGVGGGESPPEDVGLFVAMPDLAAGVDPATGGGQLKFASRLDNVYPRGGGHAVGLSATDSNLYIGTAYDVTTSPVIARIPPPYAGITEVEGDEDWTSDLGGEAILSLDLTDGV